ncbi:endonuclease/exonuclease/phosphatase family protein [Paracoccaceae bacterium GXU_MW_L88]
MRIATYNVEWFSALFGKNDRLLNDREWSRRRDVTRQQQITALSRVFQSVDADLWLIVEAPNTGRNNSTIKALVEFADYAGLRADHAIMGFENDTHQELGVLYDPAKFHVEHSPQESDRAPRFDGERDGVTFSKPPFEALIAPNGHRPFRMIGAHLKTKAPHGAKTPEEIIAFGLRNREKQIAQAHWLRDRVEDMLESGESLFVMGDFNDGPGYDPMERELGESTVEIVFGEKRPEHTRLYDPHAVEPKKEYATARFWSVEESKYLDRVIDYIMVSPDLAALNGQWRIWHPKFNTEIGANAELTEALYTASDHFPVTLDIDLPPA